MPVKFDVTSYRKNVMVFEIPMTYPSLNKTMRMGWQKRKKAQDEFQELVGKCLMGRQEKFDGAVKILIDLCFKTKNKKRRDKDNYAPKWLLDCLVKRGIIKDDNSEIIPQSADIEFYDMEPMDKTVVKVEGLRKV